MVSSAVTMSAPFFLGQVIDTIYTSSSEDFSASLRSLCIMLSGVFLCGGAANAARVYLMQISGERHRLLSVHAEWVYILNRCPSLDFFCYDYRDFDAIQRN